MANRTNKAANRRIGLLLQFARETRRKKQQDITDAGGYTKNHISAIERGVAKAPIELLLIYSDVLGMTPNEILQVQGEVPSNINPELIGLITAMNERQQAKLVEMIRAFAK